MRSWLWGRLVLSVPFLVGSALAVSAPPKPVWAKTATAIDGWCRRKDHAPQLVWSSDHHWVIEFACRGKRDNLMPHLRIRADGGNWQELLFHKGGTADYEYQGSSELLWSPDSQSFFINGGENGYTNYLLFYHLGATGWRAADIDAIARRDMVATFPPCRARNHNDEDCKRMELAPDHNVAGLAWTHGGKALIVMAQVPSVSSYGSIMGQMQGYEISVPDGRIISRMNARQLTAKWRGSMNWVPEIPSPPEYDPAPHRK